MNNMKTIVIATENQGKIIEIRELFKDSGFEVKFLSDFKEALGGVVIQENAKTFEGNALIKAIVVGDILGLVTLADDSGLCVDHLDGAPGVYTARYSEEKTDVANYTKLLNVMEGVPFEQRSCHYNCTVAIYDPATKFVETVDGQWHGRLATAPRGEKSFGYAPVFLSQEHNFQLTNAELDVEQTTPINHRGKAFRAAIGILNKYLK
jgi:XTP/dITP diphosphohydrolase